MAAGKRASMREGPLAALFRRTDDDGLGSAPSPEPPPEAPAKPAPRPGAYRAPAPSTPAAASHPEGSAAAPPPPTAPERPAAPQRPAAPAPTPAAPPRDRVEVRPQPRRDSFGSAWAEDDLPMDMLEKPGRGRYGRHQPVAAEPPRGLQAPVLRVVGVGGAGVNAVNRMVEAGVHGVELIALNTDTQSLQGSSADVTEHIGAQRTRGLGSGSDPEVGRHAAMEAYDRIKARLKGSDMVFITAGEGGGTGTGAAPVIARIAREVGALAVGVVTKPFPFEGARRGRQADEGIEDLAREVDTLIVVPNARLLSVLERGTSMVEAFRVADDVLRQGVQGISDLITLPGLINLDFADVRTIMSDAGHALLGIGMGSGEKRAAEAAQAAVASPLLETSVEGARSILLSITGGRDLSLWEVNEAAKAVQEAAHPEANIIFGAMVDEEVLDQVWVTVVATGYDGSTTHVKRSSDSESTARAARRADGEPRVSRTRQPSADIEIPEFLPHR